MTADLSPNARRELAALAQVRGPLRAEAILISHQRRDVGSCLCGWAELGKSHAGHQVAKLRDAGLLAEADSTP
jgi:DNA-binding transcriptional ArsR family regulator